MGHDYWDIKILLHVEIRGNGKKLGQKRMTLGSHSVTRTKRVLSSNLMSERKYPAQTVYMAGDKSEGYYCNSGEHIRSQSKLMGMEENEMVPG